MINQNEKNSKFKMKQQNKALQTKTWQNKLKIYHKIRLNKPNQICDGKP